MVQVLESFQGLIVGDEGKGKLVDESVERAKKLNDDKRVVVVRYQGGANAGHTMYVPSKQGILVEFVTHAAPSGLVSNVDVAIGPNVACDPEKLVKELSDAEELFGYDGRIMISERTGILFDYHRRIDAWKERVGETNIGTTKTGIGPFYIDNANRATRITFADYISPKFPNILRRVIKLKRLELEAADILNDDYVDELISTHKPIRERLSSFSERLEYRLREYLDHGDHIIVEGSQGTVLDVDMGTIPDVTSSHLLAPYAFPSLGLPRDRFKIYGVEKVYPTRVGRGNLPTLQTDGFGPRVSELAGEFGATTGRRRRVGYPDWVLIRRSVFLNQCDGIFLTRVDNVQDEEIKVCIGYEIDGQVVEEVPLDFSTVKRAIYGPETYSWRLWDDVRNLSNPQVVHKQLTTKRQAYVSGDLQLPGRLMEYMHAHDEYVRCPTVGVSIGPARGETVLLERE